MTTSLLMQIIEHKMILVVACAIKKNDKILLSQRPKGKHLEGFWEFPGGKVKSKETPEEALRRELKEELNISVNLFDLKPLTFASHTYEDFHLLMPLYLCSKWNGAITPMEKQELTWIEPKKIKNLIIPPADIPLVKTLIRELEMGL